MSAGGIRIRLDLSDFVYRVESRRMMYLDTMVVRTLADLEEKIKEEHSECNNNDLLMFLEDGFLLPTWEPIQILQPGDLIKVILQPTSTQSNNKDSKKRKRNMDESIEISAKKKSKILPKVFTSSKGKVGLDTERLKPKKNVDLKEDSSSSDSDSEEENQNTNPQNSHPNQQKNNAAKSQAVSKKIAVAEESDSSSSDSESSDSETEEDKKITAKSNVSKATNNQKNLKPAKASSSSDSDSSDSDNERNVATAKTTATKATGKIEESSSSDDSSSSDEENVTPKESVPNQVTKTQQVATVQSNDHKDSSSDDSSSDSESENTSNIQNKSTNINTNHTNDSKASNNPDNGGKRKRKRKRKNKNKNKLAPEDMPNYDVDFTNDVHSVNTGDLNKKTNNSRIVFQEDDENKNHKQEDNTEVEFSAEEIQKLYAMSKPATPVQPKANNTSTPRENIKTGNTSVPLSECEQSIIQSPQNPRNINTKVAANKKSSPFAFQPRVLTMQELKNGVQKKSVNGIQKVQDNKVTENGDTAPIKEKYYPPIDTSKDVYTNKSVIIVNPPDYSKLEAAAVDDIGIGDSVAFKMIEMSASYTPEVSDWKEGKVIAREGSVITFQVLRPTVKKRTGRFELEPEEEMEEEPIIQLDTRDIIDPRQVSSPKV